MTTAELIDELEKLRRQFVAMRGKEAGLEEMADDGVDEVGNSGDDRLHQRCP